MKNLFIITARGGSKGIKNKNLRTVNGIPLLGYRAISSLKSKHCDRIIVSTDSDKIAEAALGYGVEVPFMRPPQLAQDDTSSADVILHAMEWIEKNQETAYDTFTILQPTSPFVTHKHIDEAFDVFKNKEAHSVISVTKSKSTKLIAPIESDGAMVNHYHKMNGLNSVRRQDLQQEYFINGAVYIVSWEHFKRTKSFYSERTYAYVMPELYSVDIDEEKDLIYAEFLAKNNYVDTEFWKI